MLRTRYKKEFLLGSDTNSSRQTVANCIVGLNSATA